MREYELYHHGIKGQKWGVRRTAAQLGHRVVGAAGATGKYLYNGAKVAGKAAGRGAVKVGKATTKAAVTKVKQAISDSKEKAYYKKLHKKKLSQMTDKEISDLTKRVELEASLKDAKYESRVQNARKFYNNVAKQPVNTFFAAYTNKAIAKVFEENKDSTNNKKQEQKPNNNNNKKNQSNNQSNNKKNESFSSPSTTETTSGGDNGIKGQKREKEPSYLEKARQNSERAEGKLRSESWGTFDNVKNTKVSDTYFEKLENAMGNDTARRKAADFTEKYKMTPSNSSSKEFDDYFESEVRKEQRKHSAMGNDTARRKAADFTEKYKMTPSNSSSKEFDDYFESEVRKEQRKHRR